ncbi:hypothetical protein [Dyadobacter chenhuakuii]|uniref:Uncharacterized protein n=1 Tax=Dyadobacter chenhuakuii TaxID=2909339 RepID=A0ABY4XIG5_9BACT|nr:hypothetical protein [Dyadobacter chenhuakuii]MCF2496130.1 hypothetical protein [Dyadobacter chenhuakuii]USJ30194.1 hypothetical protein NFI80_20305 [Dyadobacter chenhuakuii]
MTKQESDQLIAEARKYIGQLYRASDGNGNVLEVSEFVATNENGSNGNYEPEALFRSDTGEFWARDLRNTVALYRVWFTN